MVNMVMEEIHKMGIKGITICASSLGKAHDPIVPMIEDGTVTCHVVVGSDGIITGAQGGHPDTAAGAKCTIVIAPLLQGRIPAICTNVTTVTTPGETVDVVITDYGIAINPRRQDLIECMKDSGLPLCTIEELRDQAYAITGEPDPVQFGDKVVGIIEARDGSIMDVVREVKEYSFD